MYHTDWSSRDVRPPWNNATNFGKGQAIHPVAINSHYVGAMQGHSIHSQDCGDSMCNAISLFIVGLRPTMCEHRVPSTAYLAAAPPRKRPRVHLVYMCI